MTRKFIEIKQNDSKMYPYLVMITRQGVPYGNEYTVTQEQVNKIVSIVKHYNFYFEIDKGEIVLFGEYGVK